jgi:plasmid stability protein
MGALTLKNIPDDLLDRLKRRAAADRRSLTMEILFLLEQSLGGGESRAAEASPEPQLAAWQQVAGRWRSTQDVVSEIRAIYGARTAGRPVDLESRP